LGAASTSAYFRADVGLSGELILAACCMPAIVLRHEIGRVAGAYTVAIHLVIFFSKIGH